MSQLSDFDDIRPYHDGEVSEVLARVLADDEFISALGRFRFPGLLRFLPWLVKPAIRFYLGRQLSGVTTVAGFQQVIEGYMTHMIETTTDGLSTSGLDKLDRNKAYLFLSNHRDIAMDPAFVNYSLYHAKMQTVRIAIGDNLLTKPFASDLMRLNKSFLVKRGDMPPRKLFAALKQLSSYIAFSLKDEQANVWMAHREGRAKDGNDKTEAAIIKMLAMSKPKDCSFPDFIRSLNIVPVSISYELDPCDEAKARELYTRSVSGTYTKAEHEDVQSIGAGISGQKGRVHLAFGEPLSADFEDADEVAAHLDREIISNYLLQTTNLMAYRALENAWPALDFDCDDVESQDEIRAVFENHIAAIPASYREHVLRMYAMPVYNKLALIGQAPEH